MAPALTHGDGASAAAAGLRSQRAQWLQGDVARVGKRGPDPAGSSSAL